MISNTLEATETECAIGRGAPRVSLRDIENEIGAVYHLTGDAMIHDAPTMPGLETLSVCLIAMRNGFMIIGKSAPASPDNYGKDLGRKLAYEDAIRQIWPLMGFALKQKLAGE